MSNSTFEDDLSLFRSAFKALTTTRPFPWQEDLYLRFFSRGEFPPLCNLPTGLGKTSVIAVWLIALARHPENLPRRLVYVVNRRTVVDQTTSEVEKLRANLQTACLCDSLSGMCALPLKDDESPLAISTLRGQFADNREWSRDPARPAVIVGTVDMIGSRLLFSGYGVGFKAKPLHAGFLGQDALIIHDEAHLEPAFQKLLKRISEEQTQSKDFAKFRVMELTATMRSANGASPFELTAEEKNPPEGMIESTASEPSINTVWRRLKARKKLVLRRVEDEKAVPGVIARMAEEYKDQQAAVLVFVRSLEAVAAVQKELGKTKRPVVLLTGTIRGRERDELVEKNEFKRFLKGAGPGETVYLVCTSAGEVGIDISADHMVCDLATFESMAQRFGRVNRYGLSKDTRITVVHPEKFDDKNKLTPAREATLKLLQQLNGDASPKALGDLTASLTEEQREAAFALPPTIPTATDILFDAWALTSITQPMPGRPEVAPYIHGIADDLPQTTIAWRAELDLLKDDPDPKAALKAMFSKHRIRPHESVTVNNFHLVQFLKEITAPRVRPALLDTRVAMIFSRGLRVTTIGALIDDPGPLNADPTLALPASFGGLDANGMLAVSKPDKKQPAAPEMTRDEAPAENEESEKPVSSLDIADKEGYERDPAAKARQRILINRSDEGWAARALPGFAPLPRDWNLDVPEDTSTRLVKHLQEKSGLKVRLVQPIKLDEEGDPVCSLVCLAPPPKQQMPVEQTLQVHVNLVEKEAERLAEALLAGEGVARAALRFAAKWHDEGKESHRWQRYIGRRNQSDPPLAKAAEWRDPKLLAGYRHEFGSLLRVREGEAPRYFAAPELDLTLKQQQDARELALHLIAAHHGYARPHFTQPWDDEFTTTVCEETHIEVVQRFGLLQRRYGRWGLAYLESLLRAADWAASRAAGNDPEMDDDDATDLEGDKL
jgi:CRISPR-associated endonuclease/helicase Cas3